jgi:hypothetical protein
VLVALAHRFTLCFSWLAALSSAALMIMAARLGRGAGRALGRDPVMIRLPTACSVPPIDFVVVAQACVTSSHA